MSSDHRIDALVSAKGILPGEPLGRSTRPGVFAGLSAAMVALVLLAGCSRGERPPLTEVRGTVTLDGQPLPGVVVRFLPVRPARASRGMTDKAGRYEFRYLRDIRGAVLGSPDHRP